MKIWITTDTHFSHKKLIGLCRSEDFEYRIKHFLEMYVSKEDLLIHLGDVCIGDDTKNNNWFKQNLKCKTYLIRGNHDKKSISWYLENGWDSVSDRLDIEMFGKKMCFTHIPVADDGSFDVNFHGHFHNTDHRKNEPEFNEILCEKHNLIALELTNYQPILLDNKTVLKIK